MKKLIALMLCIATLLSLSIPASAAGYTPEHTEEAEVLYDLGLFKGTGHNADGTPIFALEQKANRIQGLVMLIRLLGKEADALAYTGECPFTDVDPWAQKYAAYAYDNGITKGTSATTFGSDDSLVGKAYVTFVLRALGYDDGAGDFTYDDALTFGTQVGLIGSGEHTGDLYRDACAKISYTALKTNMKGTETTLLDKLVADGVLTEDLVQDGNGDDFVIDENTIHIDPDSPGVVDEETLNMPLETEDEDWYPLDNNDAETIEVPVENVTVHVPDFSDDELAEMTEEEKQKYEEYLEWVDEMNSVYEDVVGN